MNIKLINSFDDKIGIFLGIVGSILIIVSLVWSGKRLFNKENTMQEVMLETAKTTSLVFIILLGAAMLTAAFRAFGGEELVKDYLNSLPGGFWVKFIIVMAVIFVLGFFLDFIEIAVVVVPIIAPILLADPSANITAVWLGVMIGLNIQTSFLTPPFGFALFYLRGVASKTVKTIQMYKGVIPFIILQLIALSIVGIYPTLVNYLPNRVSYLSENSPPPRNPKLQLCIEEYVTVNYLDQTNKIEREINNLKSINFSKLNSQYNKIITTSIIDVEKAISSLKDANEINIVISKEKEKYFTYKDSKLKNWEKISSDFKFLVKSEQKKRLEYRRLTDTSFTKLNTLNYLFKNVEIYEGLNDEFIQILKNINSLENKTMSNKIKEFSKKINQIPYNEKIVKNLRKASRELNKKNIDLNLVRTLIEKEYKEYNDKLVSLKKVDINVIQKLNNYLKFVSNNVALRQQSKLPRNVALYLAKCNSEHRDLSIYF
jgi:succinate dehydrogenase hydrophobic anchor subunit